MQGKMYVTPPPKHYDSNDKITGTDGPTKRVYQLWKGSNKFAFGGRLIFGPDVRSMILAVFLIVVPVAMFSVFVSQKLIMEFEQNIAVLIVAVAIVFTAYILCLLFLTSSRDPGIIPRNAHPPEPEEDGDTSTLSSSWSGSQTGPPNLPPIKDVHVNGFVIKVKYCHTCMLYRPPRCSHCSVCNNCVERFDHHCPWVGQCIGKRNYRFFFMFVSSTTVLCLYIFAFCLLLLKKTMQARECNLWKAILESPVAGLLIIYTFIAAWFVGGLTVFHMYLICTNQTTYENFRYRYDGKSNPYNRGCFQNIMEIFFSSIPSSQNNFRAKVKQASAFNNSSLSLQSVSSPDMAKTSADLEMGGKRQAIADDEIEDIQSQIESVRGLERNGTQAAHFDRKSEWEINAELDEVAKALGMENGYNVRDKQEQ